MWWIYALLSAFFGGLVAILAKVGLKGVDTDVATAIRTVVILLLAWSIVAAKGMIRSVVTLNKHNLLFLILSGLATGLSWLFYFKALQLGQVSKVAPVDKLSVAVAILLGVILFKEQLTWQQITGCSLIIGGTLLLIWK